MNSTEPRTILVVDDDGTQRQLIAAFLDSKGYVCREAASAEEAVSLLQDQGVHMVIMDVRMPGMSGLEALRQIRESFPVLPVLLITAYADVRDAVAAIKDGALDYLAKPIDLQELSVAVEDALGASGAPAKPASLPQIPQGIVASSPPMTSLLSEVAVVAPSRAAVLITGESGVGKEVIADIIHLWSDRKGKPLVKVNCAAIPDSLLESELFGHEKGAFTGAVHPRSGRFEAADGGTIFLDEIAEMSPSLQAKLLRVVQDGTFQRLGGNRTYRVDVRLIAATNRDIELEVAEGRFREDLFYRLNVIQLHVPSLRERRTDILRLAHHFAQEFSGGKVRFSSAAAAALELHDWPGNVRELCNTVERACLLSRGEIILPEHLPTKMRPSDLPSRDTPDQPEGSLMEDVERTAILNALAETGGNRTQAARRLGISRRTLLYKLRRYKDEGYL
jgi:two-component system response regulator HydG